MPDFLTLLIVVSLVVLGAVALMGIGWLLTGTVRIVKGACGMDPNEIRKKSKECGTPEFHCDLCDPDKEKKEDK
jgi:Sec-independent protein translocase protein TatA